MAESRRGECHGRRYFAPRQARVLAARAVATATNSSVTQLGVQVGTHFLRTTTADWEFKLHVTQAFNQSVFAEIKSRMVAARGSAEMLPPTCAFAVHIVHRKSDGTYSSMWRRAKLFMMKVTS